MSLHTSVMLLTLAAAAGADGADGPFHSPFHSIVSERLPCVHTGQPCFAASNAFGAAAIQHWQIQSHGPHSVWPLNGSDPNHCNRSDYGIICMTDTAKVATALSALPAGQRAISPEAIYIPRIENGVLVKDAVWDLDTAGSIMPFADVWTRVVGARIDAWFGAYKAVGGKVDVVFYDQEALTFGFGHVFGKGRNNSKIFAPWQADTRWEGLLAELNSYGATYGVSFDNMTRAADTACCNSGGCAQDCDTTLNYMYVWNAVMNRRVTRMINATLFAPVVKHFPHVELSNYGQGHFDSSPTYFFGRLYGYFQMPVGAGEHVGTHSSSACYGGDSNATELTVSGPTYQVARTATPFGRTLLHARKLRSMVKGGRGHGGGAVATATGGGVPVSPWIEPRDGKWYPSGAGLMMNSSMYQEQLLHMAMAGVRRFLWWRNSHDTPTTLGIGLANCVMAEADALVGDARRVPLSVDEPVGLSDGWLLSGMALGNGTLVYRFTPSDEVTIPTLRVLDTLPATFQVGGHVVIPVKNGRLLGVPPDSCAPAGFWIAKG